VVILFVHLEVFCELGDAGGQEGDLDFRRTGVVVAALVFLDDLAAVDGHWMTLWLMRGLQKLQTAMVEVPPGPPLAMLQMDGASRKAAEL
jgi:hypothetical protein